MMYLFSKLTHDNNTLAAACIFLIFHTVIELTEQRKADYVEI